MKYVLEILRYLPQNFLSFVTGWLARVVLPRQIQKVVNGLFVTAFGIDMSESVTETEDFCSIEDLFTRTLRRDADRFLDTHVLPQTGFSQNRFQQRVLKQSKQRA